jgi:hypothetical protein
MMRMAGETPSLMMSEPNRRGYVLFYALDEKRQGAERNFHRAQKKVTDLTQN